MEQQKHAKKNKVKKEKKETFLNEKFLLHQPFDWKLIIAIILINIFGLVAIYSASYYYATANLKLDSFYFFRKQLFWFLIGIIVMIAFSYIRFQKLKFFWLPALIIAFFVIAAARIPGLRHASHGAYRWIKIRGVTLQVAEIAKVLVVFGFAGFLDKYLHRMSWKKLPVHLFLVIDAALGGIIFVLTNNLSSAMIVVLIGYIMLIMAIQKPKPLVILLISVVVIAAIAILIIVSTEYSETENFRITRIRAWWDPTNALYASDEAYQSTQGFYAIASGGFIGKGLGQSLIKFRMPEPHNDYILAIMFEEVGILGVLLLTALFVYLLYKIFRIYCQTRNRFMRYMVCGVFIHIAVQVAMNYAVVLGFFPTTGVTLPFISAGGSSLLFLFMELGFVLSADRQRNEADVYESAQQQIETDHPEFQEMKKSFEKEKEEPITKKRELERPYTTKYKNHGNHSGGNTDGK